MTSKRIFPPTTERSSHIGLEGYGYEEDWRHFLDKYKPACLKFARRYYPTHPDLVEDVFSSVVAKILTNPTVIQRKPQVRFRNVLSTLLRNAAAELYRREKTRSFDRYLHLTGQESDNKTTPDDDVRRRQLLAIDFIQQDLLRDDYENGRFSREFKPLDLDIWRELQEEDATLASVAKKLHVKVWRVFSANQRVNARIKKEATAFLASLGLL